MATRKQLPRFFTVSGTGRFPVDMLRFDACYPRTGTDALIIERSFERPRPLEAEKVVVLAKPSGEAPNAARWKSFGWEVVG